MDQQVAQIEQAILVAYDPAQVSLHQQALQYLAEIQRNSSETWSIALALFTETNPDGSRKHHPQSRFFGLRILEDFLDNRFEPLDPQTFQTIRQALLSYIQSEYLYGPAESGAPFLRNKFSHILTLFFLCTYLDQWPSFFTDIFALIRPQIPSTSQESEFNPHVSLLLFHLVLEISGEVADQMLKSARIFSAERHSRDTKVRDAVRDRDAPAINEAVLTIVADGVEKMARIRKGQAPASSMDRVTEVVDWGIRTFASYVGWIDINLTVTPTTIPLLFNLLSDSSLPIRLATANALLRMVSKGLKEPGDKLQLIKVLSLGQVLDALEEKTRLERAERGGEDDEGEESYREALGRLLNALGGELVKLVEEPHSREDVRLEAQKLLTDLRPVLLRFLADPYDDTCSTIFPLLASILGALKKVKRSSPSSITDADRSFLSSAIGTILQKMKWDEESGSDDEDDDDRHAFESLRKGDLRVHMDSILAIDQDLGIGAVQSLVMSTLAAYESGQPVKWNDAELAIYLIYIFGDINKSGGKGRAAFCQAPAVKKDQRKTTDYSDYALTVHGQMLFELIRSGLASHPHLAVVMQYFETCARYSDFFKVRKECIIPLLEAMIGPRGIHNPKRSTRSRVYYLFYKFIREDRNEIPVELVVTLLNGIRDVLTIEVELPEPDGGSEQDLLSEAANNPGIFDAQLYLFETAGILTSLTFKSPDENKALMQSNVQPLLDELSLNLQKVISAGAAAAQQDIVPILKVHHVIMALGNVAKGFPDMPSPLPENYILPPIDIFRQMTQAIVVSLEAMNVFKIVRDATRFAFARIVATTGSSVTDFIPALMTSLLAHFEPTELVDFMNFIGLLMHRLQIEMFEVLNQLVSPLHARIMELLASPVTGTDDKIAHLDTKKAYLSFLNNIMVNKLQDVFLSERNKADFAGLLENILGVAEDYSDPVCQRMAFTFLTRCVTVWGQVSPPEGVTNGSAPHAGEIPGFERFIYERLVPLSFQIPTSPNFNMKDGQVLVVLHEIAALLQTIAKVRGQEAYEFLVSVFFPAQNCPPNTALDFVTKLRDLDQKSFRKYYADFIRASSGAVSGP